jgi:hypothetical protein
MVMAFSLIPSYWTYLYLCFYQRAFCLFCDLLRALRALNKGPLCLLCYRISVAYAIA